MSLPVTLENDALRVEIFPQFGGKVASILDKADKFELLFDYAGEFPTGSTYDRPYTSGWYAGWDECFPAVAPGPYPGHPYEGVRVPDHGEVWGLPAVAEPSRNGITTIWHGLRFGYRFARTLSLDGQRIVCNYAVQNLSPFDFRFVWAQHALMSMASPAGIEIGRLNCRVDHDATGRDIQSPFTWPVTAEGDDLSDPDSLPSKRGWKIFALSPIDAPARVTYPSRERRLSIEYSSSDGTAAYWGIWINTGGWAGHHHFAIEPTTGRFDELDRCARDNSAARVEASGKREWTTTWTVG
jgi:hypothetical protein